MQAKGAAAALESVSKHEKLQLVREVRVQFVLECIRGDGDASRLLAKQPITDLHCFPFSLLLFTGSPVSPSQGILFILCFWFPPGHKRHSDIIRHQTLDSSGDGEAARRTNETPCKPEHGRAAGDVMGVRLFPGGG